MDFWEIFDLSKSKSLTVFDIGRGISPDNLNTGVARYIPLFLTTHNAHCTNSLLNFLDSIQLQGWFWNKKDFEVLSVEIMENTHVVMWKLAPLFLFLKRCNLHNEPQKKERMQILLHCLDNVREKCLRKHEWLYSVRTFENYTITIVRFEWVFRQIVKSSMISSAFSVLEEACLPYILVANCTILSHYGLHVVSPHFVSDKIMIKWY